MWLLLFLSCSTSSYLLITHEKSLLTSLIWAFFQFWRCWRLVSETSISSPPCVRQGFRWRDAQRMLCKRQQGKASGNPRFWAWILFQRNSICFWLNEGWTQAQQTSESRWDDLSQAYNCREPVRRWKILKALYLRSTDQRHCLAFTTFRPQDLQIAGLWSRTTLRDLALQAANAFGKRSCSIKLHPGLLKDIAWYTLW